MGNWLVRVVVGLWLLLIPLAWGPAPVSPRPRRWSWPTVQYRRQWSAAGYVGRRAGFALRVQVLLVVQ